MSYAGNFQRLSKNPNSVAAIALSLLVIVSVLVYWPGLNGIFQLDDFQNLEQLKPLNVNDETSVRLLNFVFGGSAGPSGRPISLATFLINDFAWPSDAWSFKYTNLLIHIFNGILIFYLSLRLLPLVPIRIAEQREKHVVIAALTASIWTLHPFQATTVLYVIQRMTELSTLFMVLGTIAYLHFRSQIDSHPRGAYIKLTAAFGLCAILAVFSKENGVLLFLYLFLLERLLLQVSNPVQHPHWKKWQGLFVIAPILVIIAYMGFHFDRYATGYAVRDFTLWERVITECRVLFDYLYQILIPKLGGYSLYHDDYEVSRGLFEPVSTIFAVIGIILLLVLSVKFRKRYALLSFAALWFFASHVLESTVMPLEIYFEHRNYLAIFGIAFAFSIYAFKLPIKIQTLGSVSVVALVVMLALFTRINADFWGQPKIAPFIWADEHPRSIRAAQDASRAALMHSNLEVAQKFISKSLRYHPSDSGLLMQNFLLKCLAGNYQISEFNQFVTKLQKSDYSSAAVTLVSYMADQAPLKECPKVDPNKVGRIINAFTNNSRFQTPKVLHLLYLRQGQIAVYNRDLDAAMHSLDKSTSYLKRAQVPLDQTKILISAGLYQDAERYLKLADSFDRGERNVFLRNLFQGEIASLDKMIKTKLENSKTSN